MTNPNETPKVEAKKVEVPAQESPKVEVIGAVNPPKAKINKAPIFTKDNFLTALVLSMGAFLTKSFIVNHSSLLSDKEYQMAHKLLLVFGLEFILVLALFLGYIIVSKSKK